MTFNMLQEVEKEKERKNEKFNKINIFNTCAIMWM